MPNNWRHRSSQGRNLQNLRVIPTSSKESFVDPNPELNKKILSALVTIPIQNQVVDPPQQNQLISSSPVATPAGTMPPAGPELLPPGTTISKKYAKNYRKRQNRRKQRRWKAMQREFADQWYDDPHYPKPIDKDRKSDSGFAPMEDLTEPEKVEKTPKAPSEENYFEEVEVASVEGEAKQEVLVGYRKTKQYYLSYKRRSLFRPKIFWLGERMFVNCLNMDEDVDVVSEAEYEEDNDNADKELKFVEIKEDEVEEAKPVSLKDVNDSKVIRRSYKTCIENSNELSQRESLIQSSLDTWKSHLLGLEYLIEVQNENKDSVVKYHCVLCDSDLSIEGLPAIFVMNHISDRKHIVRYLEKHFSAFGFKFSENATYDGDTLKKIGEEINHELGYYFMCVTSSLYYTKSKKDFKRRIVAAYHPNEKDLKLDQALTQKVFNSKLLDEVKKILSDVIDKIEPLKSDKESGDSLQSDLKNVKSLKITANIKDSGKKAFQSRQSHFKGKKQFSASKSFPASKSRISRSLLKGKGNSAFSSYLKSKYAKAAMHKKTLKELSSQLIKEPYPEEDLKKNEFEKMDTSEAVEEASEAVEKASKAVKEASEAVKEASEVVEEALEVTAEEVSVRDVKGVSDTSVKDISKTSVKDVSKTSVKDVSKSSVKDVSKTSVKDVSKTSVKDVSKTSVKDVSKTSVKDVSKMSSEDVSKGVENNTPEFNVHKTREKIPSKATHSKYCRKMTQAIPALVEWVGACPVFMMSLG